MSQRKINSLKRSVNYKGVNSLKENADCRKVKPVILVGGTSKRFGSDKAYLTVQGESVILRTHKLLKSTFNEEPLYIGREAPFSSFEALPDEVVGAGPIGGLYTALRNITADFVFLTACDMPFINGKVLKYMIDHLQDKIMIYLPRFKNGMIEPLFAFYNKELLRCVSKKINEGEFRLRSLISCGAVQYLEEQEIRSIDLELLCFLNINTRDDLDRINEWSNLERNRDL